MHTETALLWVRRLCAALDEQLEAALPPSEDDVYTLVGLLRELDRALCTGARLPREWASALPAPVVSAPSALEKLGVSLAAQPVENDTGRRRRKPRRRPLEQQLELPLPA